MSSVIRFAVGILGNCTSLLMYGAPVITFRRIIKQRSTEDFSGFPYAVALLNCLLYAWYGSPMVSNGSENILVATVNGIGIALELSFVCLYLIFAPPEAKKIMWRTFVAILVLFSAIAAAALIALHDHGHRKLLVGSAGMAITVIMYGSPLSVIKLVIRTKSVEFMPFYLSFFSFLSSVLWTTYGALGRDIILAAPNIIGVPLGLSQIVVYCVYRNKNSQSTCKEGKLDQPDPEMGLQLKNGFSRIKEGKSHSPTECECVEMQGRVSHQCVEIQNKQTEDKLNTF